MEYDIAHHRIIGSALKQFNADFFCANDIVFGGGTRIALEIDEFRESVDIDFLCPTQASYRAVRQQVTNVSLGQLVKSDFEYPREIRADRDAVRTLIVHEGCTIKLEFVNFKQCDIRWDGAPDVFPVPCLDHTSCFATKLMANADRWGNPPYKDIFDILAMYRQWGDIPAEAIAAAEAEYGERVILPALKSALQDVLANPEKYQEAAANVLMKPDWADDLIKVRAEQLLGTMT